MPRRPQPLPPQLSDDVTPIGLWPQLGVSVERARRTDVTRPFRGVVAAGFATDDLVSSAVALTARRHMPPFGFSHQTAAHLLGLPLPSDIDHRTLHVTVAHPARAPRLVGVSGHAYRLGPQSFQLQPVTVGGIHEERYLPVLDDGLLFATLASALRLDDLVAVADALRWRASRARKPCDLAHALTPGRIGSDRGRRALALSVDGVRSRPESLLRLILARAGLPTPTIGHVITGSSWSATPDLAWPQFHVLVEYEGDHHRTSERQFSHDIRRFDRYADQGWSAVRAVKADVFDDPRELVGRIARRLRGGGWRPHKRWQPGRARPAHR